MTGNVNSGRNNAMVRSTRAVKKAHMKAIMPKDTAPAGLAHLAATLLPDGASKEKHKKPMTDWEYSIPEKPGSMKIITVTCQAYTKSEARALLAKQLNIEKLPAGTAAQLKKKPAQPVSATK
jgi:hypothetical protein